GISEIRIWGEKKVSMKVNLDPQKLAGYGITAMDDRKALIAQNVELPSGRIEGDNVELTIRTFGRLTEEEEFNNLIIAERDNQLIKLKDVGEAVLADRKSTRLNSSHV